MERTDQLKELRQTVCDYYELEYSLLDSDSRKTPIPYLKKIVSFFAYEYLKINQELIAEHFGQHRSNVCTHITTLKKYLEVNKRLKREIKDLERILSERGIWKGNIQNRRYYNFVDLNNCISASLNDKKILFVNHSVKEVKQLLGEEWIVEVHEKTNKIFYSKINKNINV